DDDEANPESPQGLEPAQEWLRKGVSILAFPEGSRSPDGRMRRFKNGAFLLAVKAGVPVVPVVLDGTGACVRKGSFWVHPPDLHLRVLPAVQTKGFEGELGAARLKAEVHSRMAAALAEIRAGKPRGVAWPHGVPARLAMAALALLLAAVTGLSIYVNNWCIATPPAFEGDRSLKQQQVVERGDVRRLGPNWRRSRGGVHELAVSGGDWERGYANAMLTPDLLEKQERHLLNTVEEFLPNAGTRWLARNLLALNNRDLPLHVTEAEKIEVLGLVEGSVDHHPGDVPLYHRVLNYHAAHDISHMFIDSPLVRRADLVGCSAFAAWGPASAGGEMIVARNFDFEAGKVFDEDKAIVYVWPKDGIAYVHVAWAGMAGAVTGMNAEGLSIHLNAGRTDDLGFGRIGTPITMVVRRVLERARTIEEAHAILREATVFVSDSFLVASAKENRAVVIEKSPERCALREAGREGLLLQTNHFLCPEFAEDAANREQMERATTLYRWGRLEELTGAQYGKLDTKGALAILRDRKGKGGKELGLGNRNTIDACICSHSVIMNLSRGEMWVSSGPHTFGNYIRVDVRRVLAAGPENALRLSNDPQADLPRDPELARGYDFDEFLKQRKAAVKALEEEDEEIADAAVRTMANLNPESFETRYLQGRLALLREKPAEAAKHFQAALDRDPHYEEVREQLRVLLQQAEDDAK
ncbi:MAG: 1-acyl-sn-glycerol-3-phosphate acyltransferase, partial [Planctomycetes bacterium]|nr:1-acyl-sn-glycerol-3-phosphate acyltransferase [Planctomycetota bacterium]